MYTSDNLKDDKGILTWLQVNITYIYIGLPRITVLLSGFAFIEKKLKKPFRPLLSLKSSIYTWRLAFNSSNTRYINQIFDFH